MSNLKADDLVLATIALRRLTEITKETGCHFDAVGLSVTLPNGDFYTVRWSGEGDDGQYALAVNEG
ncbi:MULTISPECIES: hypothetical protein [unclassified Streptomyces]|uniref:hypothetical protein n=1 Tax=unclassified Streptomyces TaxID=2593676 RepID=UPI00224FAF24|nr:MULTISPECIES: hypothetical protein [unclassified Streptomyces]MCX5335477.1 hypothetical protein [Streptomyces sp. NBC_00140]MCX5338343.1 hypothetical protein [Streptomyces sp. NBC_00140]MCX5365957.1 hypothetical protein [Streptomyces sp. NBC_00124]